RVPAGAQPLPMVWSENLWDHPFGTFGFPERLDQGGYSSGVLRGPNATGRVQMIFNQSDLPVEKGFSGAPVWDFRLEGAVGMVALGYKTESLAVAFMIPTRILVEMWPDLDRKSTRLNSSHLGISYAVFCLKKK